MLLSSSKGTYLCPFCRANIVPINENEKAPDLFVGHVFRLTKFDHSRHSWSAEDRRFYAEPVDESFFDNESDLYVQDWDEIDGFAVSGPSGRSHPHRAEHFLYEYFYEERPHPQPPPGWAETMDRIRNSTPSRYNETEYIF